MKLNHKDKEFLPKEWIKRAKDNELTALSLLKHRDAPPNGVCFVSQQMGGKYLKAFLIDRKKWYPKVHILVRLLEFCLEIDKTFVELKDDSALLDTFYVETRYPGDYPEFSWPEAEQAFTAAKKIKDFVLEKLKK